MQHNHIPLKQRRDVGQIITAYFDFFKQNLKPFLNIFISYNGLFILGFLLVSYLMVTGFVGLYIATPDSGQGNALASAEMYFVFGFLGFFFLFIVTAILNYSLAAVYTIEYERHKGPALEKAKVWQLIRQNLGRIFLFIILMILLYLLVMGVGVVLAFIPILGTLAYYLLILGFTSWMGLSFMAMLNENKDVADAFGEGWKLLTKFFWKSVLSNLVIGLLLAILFMVVLMVPGILIGVYAFHASENGIDLAQSPVANIIWTITLAILLILYTLNQSLIQFINGVLYFSLHEEVYNEAARERIEKIGSGE